MRLDLRAADCLSHDDALRGAQPQGVPRAAVVDPATDDGGKTGTRTVSMDFLDDAAGACAGEDPMLLLMVIARPIEVHDIDEMKWSHGDAIVGAGGSAKIAHPDKLQPLGVRFVAVGGVRRDRVDLHFLPLIG